MLRLMPTNPFEPPKGRLKWLDAIAFWVLLVIIGAVVLWLYILEFKTSRGCLDGSPAK